MQYEYCDIKIFSFLLNENEVAFLKSFLILYEAQCIEDKRKYEFHNMQNTEIAALNEKHLFHCRSLLHKLGGVNY